MTAWDIEQIIFNYRTAKGDRLIVPNVHYPWECDVVSVTRSGYAHEYEIKISRSDFFADAKKDKHQFIKGVKTMWHTTARASYLWYVVPNDLVTADEIPDYAGLLYVLNSEKWLHKVKPAPQIHAEKVTEKHRIQLLHSMMFRYWQLRREVKRERQNKLAF